MKTLNMIAFPYEPEENQDWNFARTTRFLLRNEVCEFGLSVYSVPVKIKTESEELSLTSPNRDYPYEGLIVLTMGESWKFLDCLAFALLKNKKALTLQPASVSTATSFLNYSYTITDSNGKIGSLNVIYWLDDNYACLNEAFQVRLPSSYSGLTLVAVPFVDMRHIYSKSEPHLHQTNVTAKEKTVEVKKDKRMIKIYTPNRDVDIKKLEKGHDWFYKLGDGFRVVTQEGVKFSGEHRELFTPALFYVEFSSSSNVVFRITVGLESEEEKISGRTFEETAKKELERLSLLHRSFPLRKVSDQQICNSILARIDAFTKFKMKVSLPKKNTVFFIPEAGAWWFRTVWFRDIYLNLLQNMKTLELIDNKLEPIRDAILLGIEYFDDSTGRVPNSLPTKSSENPSYDSADSTLLFFTLACEYVRKTENTPLATKILELLDKTLQRWSETSVDTANGPPVIMEDGLLACVPWHSWTDSKRTVTLSSLTVEALPTRIPRQWQLEKLEVSSNPSEIWRFFNTPKFYLPEVNALWLHLLELVGNLDKTVKQPYSSLLDEVKKILQLAKENYLKVFWNEKEGVVYDVVSYDLSWRDKTEGSSGVVAAAILQDLFSQDRLNKVWKTVKDCLLVYRKTVWLKKYENKILPFGVLVKNYMDRVYLGDEQYHGAVVWPRDTPFLIRLLDRLKEYDTIRGLLLSNLDHQMSEGTIFYNHELFSLPMGKNPSPIEGFKDNPVPVKNPAQFWSQWVDPYLEYDL